MQTFYRGLAILHKPGKKLNHKGQPMVAGEIYWEGNREWVPQQETAEQMLAEARERIDAKIGREDIVAKFLRMKLV